MTTELYADDGARYSVDTDPEGITRVSRLWRVYRGWNDCTDIPGFCLWSTDEAGAHDVVCSALRSGGLQRLAKLYPE